MVVNIIFTYCCTRVRCTRKMLKETETEETIGFFVTFLPLHTYCECKILADAQKFRKIKKELIFLLFF